MTTAVEAVDFEEERITRSTVDTGLRAAHGDLPLGEHRVDEFELLPRPSARHPETD